MPHARDGTEPMIAHGPVYPPRRRSATTCPCSCRWFGDARTTRTLSSRRADVARVRGGLVRAGRREPGPRRLPLRDLPRRGRPADRHDRAVRPGPPQRQRGPRDLDRRPGRHGPGLRLATRCARSSASAFGQLRLERIWLDVYAFNPRARRVYERLGFVHEGDVAPRALPRSGSTSTSTGWRSSPTSGGRERAEPRRPGRAG